MARHRGRGRRCVFESLENRRLLAGDVTARIVKGDLVITGDKLDNGITIVGGATAGTVVVTGINAGGSATNVNGTTNGAVTLTGFTGDLKIKMKAGNDVVTISDLEIAGKAKIKLGKGNDTLSLESVEVAEKAKIKGRRGDDEVTIEDSTFTKLEVSLSKGDDLLSISDTTVSEKTRLKGGRGTNTFENSDDNTFADLKLKRFDEEPVTSQRLTLAISGAASINEGAVYTLSLSASGDDAASISKWTINWGDGTSAQVVNGNPTSVTHTFAEGPNSFSIRATATTPEGTSAAGNEVAVTVGNVSPAVALNAVTAIVENGTATLTGSYTDIGLLDAHTMTVNWGDVNNTTNSVFAIGATGALTGSPTFTSTSGDGAVLTVTSFNTTTGVVNFSVQHKYVDDGLAGTLQTPGNNTTSDASTIAVTVTDDDSNNGGSSTSVTVSNAAPTVGTLAASAVQENGSTTLTGSFTDVGLRDLHGVTINWGDPNNSANSQFVLSAVGSLTVGQLFASGTEDDDTVLTITSVNPTTGQVGFSVQHQYADDGTAPGNATTSDSSTITVTVNDDDGQSASSTTAVTVSNVAPTLSDLSPATQTINEGTVATVTTTITDPGTRDVFTVTVNWQDGATDTITLGTSSSNGTAGGTTYVWLATLRQLAVSHRYLDGAATQDNRTVTMGVRDDDNIATLAPTKTATVTVNNVAPSLAISGPTSVTENTSSSWTLGAVVEPGTDTVASYVVNWGDGNTSNFTAAEIATASRVISHTYADGPNNYTISVSLIDEDGTHTAAGTLNVAVTNVAPTLALSGAANANEGSLYTLTLSSTDAPADTITKWTINWGDNTGEEVVNGDPTSATHTYADNGNYTISATATDEDGTHTAGNTVNVAVQNVVPALAISGAASVNEGSLYTLNLLSTDSGADTISKWTINWGDGTGEEVVNGDPTTASHTYLDDGNYTISATATDEDGTFAAGNNVEVAVQKVAPTLALTGPTNVVENTSNNWTLGEVVDPGADNVSNYIIHWGDGNTDNFTAVDIADTSGVVSHTYAATNSYTISVDLVDEDGTYISVTTLNVTVSTTVN
jgi:hypothetical protein